jgi:hypothetical protein
MLNSKFVKFLKKEIITEDTALALFMGLILAATVIHIAQRWDYYGMR